MSVMTLTRWAYAPFGTYGTLEIGEHKFYTVEQPWNDNKKRISCVPQGMYSLIPHSSAKYPNCWALIGPDQNVHYQPGPSLPPDARYAILVHAGNVPSDVMGCICPGKGISFMKGQWAITSSGAALNELRTLIPRLGIQKIEIRQYNFQYGNPPNTLFPTN